MTEKGETLTAMHANKQLITGFLMIRTSVYARSVEPRSSFLMSYLVGRIVSL
jgi:hypothetical protein